MTCNWGIAVCVNVSKSRNAGNFYSAMNPETLPESMLACVSESTADAVKVGGVVTSCDFWRSEPGA